MENDNRNSAIITLRNGLGDKLLDIIGFYVICKCLNYKSYVRFNKLVEEFDWGFGSNTTYDLKLFEFNDIIISDFEECHYYIRSVNPSSTLCPYKVYMFVSQFLPEITFGDISERFVLYARDIFKPSEIIDSRIPEGIENAYGIHLRKTDKVIAEGGDLRHVSSIDEFNIIISNLLDDVNNIILRERDPVFFITSEDDKWKMEMTSVIQKMGASIRILTPIYMEDRNSNSVLDMFCLSKCKLILQGVKYSSFSMIASILGARKLINYSHLLESRDICLLPSWNSVVEINGKTNVDLSLHERVTEGVTVLSTNIIPPSSCGKP
jgi:hypothetical protein